MDQSTIEKARVGKQLYGPTAANPYIHSSAKWVRRYRVRPTQLRSDLMVTRFQFVSQRFKLLYLLGSDSLLKFETSKFLRSNQVDTWFCFALFRYAKHIAEPFRTRAKSQLKLILQFRHSDAPPNNIPIRLWVVNDEMAFNVRKWLVVGYDISVPSSVSTSPQSSGTSCIRQRQDAGNILLQVSTKTEVLAP